MKDRPKGGLKGRFVKWDYAFLNEILNSILS